MEMRNALREEDMLSFPPAKKRKYNSKRIVLLAILLSPHEDSKFRGAICVAITSYSSIQAQGRRHGLFRCAPTREKVGLVRVYHNEGVSLTFTPSSAHVL